MTDTTFKAYRVFEENGTFGRKLVNRSVSELPEGEVLIRVKYAGLNYKDALSASGNRGVTRNYPHTPGIDAAGIVEDSLSPLFKPGDEVAVTSYDLGMNTDGAFAEFIRVPANWIVPLPKGLTLAESMMLGTSGLTAALSVKRLLDAGQKLVDGPVVVTGAAGGVGSLAVKILLKEGFEVIAATSNLEDSREVIEKLGAHLHIDKSETDDQSGRPLIRPKWAGAVDVVGGNTLATLLKACKYGGNVTTCGNIGSGELNTTVYPFILNNISLLGVDSQKTPLEERKAVWEKLAGAWKPDGLDDLATFISLDELETYIQRLLNKKNRGQVVLKL
jgi:acrylyl-CoA reductase (NADPH)